MKTKSDSVQRRYNHAIMPIFAPIKFPAVIAAIAMLCCCQCASANASPLEIRAISLPDSVNYFHPSIVVRPDGSWLLSVQSILGSDYCDGPRYACSVDHGITWSEFAPIPPFATRKISENLREGVLDVRPFCFGNNPEVFFFGCTAVYSPAGNIFLQKLKEPLPPTRAVCAILHPDGSWTSQELKLPVETNDRRTTCIQAVFCPPDRVLLPFHFATGTGSYIGQSVPRFGVATARYKIRNGALEFEKMSNILNLEAGRGLLEPSLIRLDNGDIALTLRAEDGHGYAAVSKDGLQWGKIMPWSWDDGTPLEMTTTQQHWLRIGKKIYLVYTRKDASNLHIMRNRAPLYLAEALPAKGILLRSTEQIVFPKQTRNGVEALYGNFHAASLDENRAVITDAALFSGKKWETILMGAVVSAK